jgi:hypothetical protein
VTEIFVPYLHYGNKTINTKVNFGECYYDEEKQTLYHYYKSDEAPKQVTIELGVITPQSCTVM